MADGELACALCSEIIGDKQASIRCGVGCKAYFHASCVGVSIELAYCVSNDESFLYRCKKCLTSQLTPCDSVSQIHTRQEEMFKLILNLQTKVSCCIELIESQRSEIFELKNEGRANKGPCYGSTYAEKVVNGQDCSLVKPVPLVNPQANSIHKNSSMIRVDYVKNPPQPTMTKNVNKRVTFVHETKSDDNVVSKENRRVVAVTKMSAPDDGDDFIEVKTRRRRRTPLAVDTQPPTSCDLSAIPRKTHLHVWRFLPETTVEDISDFILKVVPEVSSKDLEVEQLKVCWCKIIVKMVRFNDDGVIWWNEWISIIANKTRVLFHRRFLMLSTGFNGSASFSRQIRKC